MKSAEKKSQIGESVVRIEAEALRELAARIRGPMADAFDHALALLHACKGRVVVTGMGKSGIIARKVAASAPRARLRSFCIPPRPFMVIWACWFAET